MLCYICFLRFLLALTDTCNRYWCLQSNKKMWISLKLSLQLMLIGRVLTDGRLNARLKCDLTDDLSLKANAQVTHVIFLFTFWSCVLASTIVHVIFMRLLLSWVPKHYFPSSLQMSLICRMPCSTLITRLVLLILPYQVWLLGVSICLLCSVDKICNRCNGYFFCSTFTVK